MQNIGQAMAWPAPPPSSPRPAKAIDSILKNYSVLQNELEIVQQEKDEYGMKARGYLHAMDKFKTYFGLKLSFQIFSATEQLSTTLQGINTCLQEAVTASRLAISFLERQRNDEAFDCFYSSVLLESRELTEEPVLPRQRHPPKRIEDGSSPHNCKDPKSLLKKDYYEVLDITIQELKHRFEQSRGMSTAAAIEKVLLTSANGAFPGIPDELNLYEKDIQMDRLEIQLQMLPDMIKTFNKSHPQTKVLKVTLIRTLCDVINAIPACKSMLNEVSKLLNIFLTIPVTTATAERTFSTLRRLKSYLRSTLTQKKLNNFMLLHSHKDITDKIDVYRVAAKFVELNERRKNYFGTY